MVRILFKKRGIWKIRSKGRFNSSADRIIINKRLFLLWLRMAREREGWLGKGSPGFRIIIKKWFKCIGRVLFQFGEWIIEIKRNGRNKNWALCPV